MQRHEVQSVDNQDGSCHAERGLPFQDLSLFAREVPQGERRRRMSKEQSKEYAEQLKRSAKELIDGIGTETEEEQRIVTLIYGFIRSGFLKSRSGKGDVSA